MATPPNGTTLLLGKLGRATAVGNSDDPSSTLLASAGGTGTNPVSMSQFYVGAVNNSLTGYQYVDEQTNETYTMGFTDNNSLFDSRIATRHQNFTWTSNNDSLFGPQDNQDHTAVYEAGTIAEAANTGFISKSFESNIVTDFDFNNWTTDNFLGNWDNTGGQLMEANHIFKQSITTAPSSSNAFALRMGFKGGTVAQTMTVKGNSVYEIVAHSSASNAGLDQIELEISGAYSQETIKGISGDGVWKKTRDDFYTSGSSGTTQNLKLTFTQVSHSVGALVDSVFVRRWEGANFSDTEVIISGKFHEAGQSDGFNDHATRYNTNINKTVEIQDTYGGLASACFLPGTLIRMSDGTDKKIEELSVGEEVLAAQVPNMPLVFDHRDSWSTWSSTPTIYPPNINWSQNYHEMQELNRTSTSTSTISDIFFDYMDSYYLINGEVKATSEHPFFVFDGSDYRFVSTLNLQIGWFLYTIDNEFEKIFSINKINDPQEVVNINVEPLDVYFADGILVHNKGTDSDPA